MLWPKPMPNHWLMGSATGVAVDARDHVFVVHRVDSFTARTETGGAATPPIGECCFSAPPVLEFDAEGNLVGSWGGPVTYRCLGRRRFRAGLGRGARRGDQ
jgi:hypothetical protein